MTMIRGFAARGYRRLYTTPHILADFYPNTPETILGGLATVQAAIKEEGLDIELYAAAEYYLDDSFVEAVAENKPLLSFGSKKYLLFETAFINEPAYLRQVIFDLFSNGYTPILAHPERYQYFFESTDAIDQIFDTGALFQLNYLSFVGYYAPPVTRLAEYLVENGKVHFIGSDCHKPRHLEAMKALDKSKSWRKVLQMPLLNREI
jgi:tyrosine-protein phosphatase YwqE